MIVSAVRPAMIRGSATLRRPAFTLLEVLVVVAILVILASIGGVYMFRFLEDAKSDATVLKMQALENACKHFAAKNDGQWPPDLVSLIAPPDGADPFVEGGQLAIQSSWGSPINYAIQAGPGGEEVPVFHAQSPDGKRLAVWPKWAK